jgi:hypothetical protein
VDVFDDSLSEVTIELTGEPPIQLWVVEEVDITVQW